MKLKKNSIHEFLKGGRARTSLRRNQRAVSRGSSRLCCSRQLPLPQVFCPSSVAPSRSFFPPPTPPPPHRKAGFLSWAAGTWLLPNAFIFYVLGETIHTLHSWQSLCPRILENVSACFQGRSELCFEVASMDTDLFGGHAVISRGRKSQTIIFGTCVVMIILTVTRRGMNVNIRTCKSISEPVGGREETRVCASDPRTVPRGRSKVLWAVIPPQPLSRATPGPWGQTARSDNRALGAKQAALTNETI